MIRHRHQEESRDIWQFGSVPPPPGLLEPLSYTRIGRMASSRNGYSVHVPYMAATSRAGVLVDRLPQGGLDAICPLS